MKRILLSFILILVLLFSAACGTIEKTDALSGIVVVDDLGREVKITSFSKVAALTGSLGDIWMLAGGDLSAVAEDAWSELGLALDADTENLGSSHAISKDSIISLAPDLVIASSRLSNQLELKEAFEGCGIKVVYFDIPDLDGYLRVLKLFCGITGRSELYAEHGEKVADEVAEIIEKSRGKEAQKVLVLRASSSSIKVKNSEGTMLGGMLYDLGCVNIADSDRMILESMSVEGILLADPDKIFVLQMGDDMDTVKAGIERMFEENPLWYELGAVKEGKVYFMEKRLYNIKPNARFGEAYDGLWSILNES
jgi:iron complex transport system substrate-binding protein